MGQRWFAIIVLAVAAVFTQSQSVVAQTAGQSAPSPLAARIKTLLDEGFVVGPGRVQAAQQQVAAARSIAAGDPRLDYAYGLVLLKQSQPSQARVQFDAATRRPGDAYWSAWQALIRSQLIEKQYDDGLTRLEDFARLVRNSSAEDANSPAQRDAARWIGGVLEALGITVLPAKAGDRLALSEIRLRQAVGDALWQEVQAGGNAVRAHYEKLVAESERTGELVAVKKEQERSDQAEKVEATLSGIDQERKESGRTAQELKKQLEDDLAKLDKQLGGLERDYQFFERQATSIQQSWIAIGPEITLMQSRLAPLRQAQPTSALRMVTGSDPFLQRLGEQRLALLQNQMAAYEREYAAAGLRMTQLSQQANVVVQQRASVVRQYEAATGKLVRKNAALDKWAVRANDKKKGLAAAAAKPTKPAANDARLRSFGTYVPLDLEAEKKRLLDSF